MRLGIEIINNYLSVLFRILFKCGKSLRIEILAKAGEAELEITNDNPRNVLFNIRIFLDYQNHHHELVLFTQVSWYWLGRKKVDYRDALS